MDIVGKISDFGKNVAQKSGELAESSKLAVNIRIREREVRNLMYEIGSYIYDRHVSGQEFDEDISVICNDIDAVLEEISRLRAEREAIGDNDEEVEVIKTDSLGTEDDFEITPEEEEMLKDI